MITETIDTPIFNVTWYEDHPQVGGHAKFRIFDDHGVAQIEMINSSGESVGVSPAKVCMTTDKGKKALRAGLQTSKLDFGNSFIFGDLNEKVRSKLKKNTGQTAEFPLILTAGPTKNLIHIRDDFDEGNQIQSTFSPATAR